MFEAARVDDDIGHSGALAGMIAAVGGIAAGAMFVAGIGASCLGVGVLLVGASLAVGYLTGELATAARDSIADAGAASVSPSGIILTGSPDVYINGRPAASTGDRTTCDAKVMTGSDNVRIGGDPEQTLPVQSEVPEWLYKVSDLTLLLAGLVGGGGGAAKAGALAKLPAKIPGINRQAVGIIARPAA